MVFCPYYTVYCFSIYHFDFDCWFDFLNLVVTDTYNYFLKIFISAKRRVFVAVRREIQISTEERAVRDERENRFWLRERERAIRRKKNIAWIRLGKCAAYACTKKKAFSSLGEYSRTVERSQRVNVCALSLCEAFVVDFWWKCLERNECLRQFVKSSVAVNVPFSVANLPINESERHIYQR